ncbi:MATE family efflux transporter [Jeongeupia naejangsanensis]|uniref:MATE family efflux transporter n=1 Tax=Jeongeupia naejangsanensis TaxID=613195 RepID=A0ABS2BML4_9NEIS|nr:MATE family efflux transporter [Jeongeupia naejangsanensis]MBM3116859.1 MATE family efflux transporter [Jeongeupia naejangsanensis]
MLTISPRLRLALHEFYALAIPVMLQLLFMSARNITDIVLTANLGEVAVATVGLASKAVMVGMVALAGLASGCSVLGAQYAGQGDLHGLRRSIGLGLLLSVVFILVPVAIGFGFFAEAIIRLASTDPAVIANATGYLRIFAGAFAFMAVSTVLGIGLRVCGHAGTATKLSLIGVVANVVLCVLLINGAGPLPALGIMGAAWATLISTALEAALVLAWIALRKPGLLPRWRDLAALPPGFARHYLGIAVPATVNGLVWSLGIFTYGAIYGRIGTRELAIMASLTPLEAVSIAVEQGLATATSILLGHRLGQGRFAQARRLGWLYLRISIGTSVLLGMALLLAMPLLLQVFRLEGAAHTVAMQVYVVMVITFWIKTINAVGISGVLRSGGDVGAGLKIDVIGQWCVGIPLALLGAFYFALPLPAVFVLVMLEDVVKAVLTTRRIHRSLWIRSVIPSLGRVQLGTPG